jgi:hypothetical protein
MLEPSKFIITLTVLIIVDLFGYQTNASFLIAMFSFLTGIYYNLDNIVQGYLGAKDKSKAFQCLVPYIQVYVLIYLMSFSRFYYSSSLLFFAGLGLFQTYVAGLLNIASTAEIAFPYLYWEPFVAALILIADA